MPQSTEWLPASPPKTHSQHQPLSHPSKSPLGTFLSGLPSLLWFHSLFTLSWLHTLWCCHRSVPCSCLQSGLLSLRGPLSHIDLDLPCPSAGCYPWASLTQAGLRRDHGNLSSRSALQLASHVPPIDTQALALPSQGALHVPCGLEFSEHCETDQSEC